MRGSLADVPSTIDSPEITIREAEWDDIHIGFESYRDRVDMRPLLKGLPDDRCQSPHWGYVLKGRLRVDTGEGEEIIEAGDAYYLKPGHTGVVEAGTELVEFSPKDLYAKTMEVVNRNFAEMEKG